MGKTMYLDGANNVFGAPEVRISAFWVAALGLCKGHVWEKESPRLGNKDG